MGEHPGRVWGYQNSDFMVRKEYSPQISLAEIAVDLFCLSVSPPVKRGVVHFPGKKKLGSETKTTQAFFFLISGNLMLPSPNPFISSLILFGFPVRTGALQKED